MDEIPVLIRCTGKGAIAQNASIVDQNVNTPERVQGRLDNGIAILHAVVVRHGLAPRINDFLHHLVRSGGALAAALHVAAKIIDCREQDSAAVPTTDAPRAAKESAYAFPRPDS